MTDFIDLTLSDSEPEQGRSAKRQKSSGSQRWWPSSRQQQAGNSDDEVLIVEQERPNAEAAAAAARVALGEDEDLVVVAERGEVWNSDLPHTRDLCGVHRFQKRPCVENTVHCSKCYCYICDTLASQCQQWGSGGAAGDHCNAHSGDRFYKTLRAGRQTSGLVGSRAALLPSPMLGGGARAAAQAPPLPPRPGSAAGAWVAAVGVAAGAAPGAARPQTAAAAADAAVKANLQRQLYAGRMGRYMGVEYEEDEEDRYMYGDDEEDEDMYEEGYGDEEEDDYYEDELARLLRLGVMGPFPPRGPMFGGAGRPAAQRPCNQVEMADPAQDPSLMELATIELRCKAAKDLTIPQIAKRLVPNGFYVGTNIRDISYGDKVWLENIMDESYDHVGGKHKPEVLKLSKLHIPPAPAEPGPQRMRKVTIMHHDGRAAPTTYGISVSKEATVEEVKAAAALLAGLRHSEELLAVHLGEGSLDMVDPRTKITDDRSKHPSLAIGLWRVPKPPKADASYPSFAVVYHKVHKPGQYPEYHSIGRPTVLQLGAAYANGGRAAEIKMLERLIAALAPLRKDGAPPARVDAWQQAGVRLLRSTRHNSSYSSALMEPFATHKHYASASQYGERSFHDGKLYLRLEWPEAELQHYDFDALSNPAVDNSASGAAMKATEDYIKAHAEWSSLRSQAKMLPRLMLRELALVSKVRQPGVPYPTYAHGGKPLLRVKLALEPESASPDEIRGRLRVSVYVWRTAGARNHPFFRSHDEWETMKGMRGILGEPEHVGSVPSVMRVLLWEHAEAKAMQARIEEWEKKDAYARHSIKGLMEAMERGEMPAAQQPAGLTVQMRPYQLQSLQFMLECERGSGGFRRHLWLQLFMPNGQRWWYSPLLKRAALTVPTMPWGGFCCEEMGLGKTVEVLGLVLANPAPSLPAGPAGYHKDENGYILSRATLVVCPVSLVGQWMAEAQAKLGGSLRMHMYHGQSRIRDPVRLATEFDLVVTTYATLNADYSSKAEKGKKAPAPTVNGRNANKFPPLGSIKWHRLVLDESHTVKNQTVGHTRACMALQANRRWMATGTPICNAVEDLFGQLCVLGMSPFNNSNFFNSHVKAAFQPSHMGGGCPQLMYMLGQCMVRHTKRQVLGGEEVLNLPPLHQTDVPVVLTAEEQKLYLDAHAKSKDLFEKYLQLGNAQINRHLLQIMALLLPMRKVCSGGNLRPKDLAVNDPLFGPGGLGPRGRAAAVAGLNDKDTSLVAPEEECPVCMDNWEAPVMTACHHWFCKECILGVIQANPKCPLCRAALLAAELRAGVTAGEAAAAARAAAGEGEEEGDGDGDEAAAAVQAVASESKLQALLKELRAMRRADPTAKALVFSQYTSTVEWLKVRLTQEGFGYRFINGAMPLKQRAKAIESFQHDPPTTVFLLSMRSGSVGINLTAASHVFLMEPALNPALEAQAIGRSWRMGQTRSVTVKRFYVKGSVEEQIIEVAKARQHAAGGGSAAAGAAAAAAGGLDDEGEGMRRRGRTNVRMQDVAGSIQSDRQQLRVSELQLLFKDPTFPAPRVPEPPSEDEEDQEGRRGAPAAAIAAGGGRGRGRPRRAAALESAQRQRQQQQQQQAAEEEGEGDEEGAGRAPPSGGHLRAGGGGRGRRAATISGAAAAAAWPMQQQQQLQQILLQQQQRLQQILQQQHPQQQQQIRAAAPGPETVEDDEEGEGEEDRDPLGLEAASGSVSDDSEYQPSDEEEQPRPRRKRGRSVMEGSDSDY